MTCFRMRDRLTSKRCGSSVCYPSRRRAFGNAHSIHLDASPYESRGGADLRFRIGLIDDINYQLQDSLSRFGIDLVDEDGQAWRVGRLRIFESAIR